MQGSREVIAATVFVPNAANPVVRAYMRNCYGATPGSNPVTVAPGHWQVHVPQDLDELTTSITARSQSLDVPTPGATRNVSVVLTRNTPTPDVTRVDIYVRDDGGTLLADEPSVEVTLARLPL